MVVNAQWTKVGEKNSRENNNSESLVKRKNGLECLITNGFKCNNK